MLGPSRVKARQLTLGQAVQKALAHDPGAKSAKALVAQKRARLSSNKALYGPTLSLSANLFVFNGAYEVAFSLPESLTSMLPPGSIPKMVSREMTTRSLGVKLVQPLTSLFKIKKAVELSRTDVDATQQKVHQSRHKTAYDTINAYLSLLKARRLSLIAKEALQLAQAYLDKSKLFYKMGVISLDGVLKAELHVATAKQYILKAGTGVDLSFARLNMLCGLKQGARWAPVDNLPKALPASLPVLKALQQRALGQRLEFKELEVRQKQAGQAVSLAKLAWLPDLALVGAYEHQKGVPFDQENKFFIGGALTWTAWDWGHRSRKIDEARAGKTVLKHQLTLARDMISLQLRAAYMKLRMAKNSLPVVQAALRQARENLRLVNARFEAKAATSTDVLNAQNMLTRAQVDLASARYDYYLAHYELKRATGDAPRFSGNSTSWIR